MIHHLSHTLLLPLAFSPCGRLGTVAARITSNTENFFASDAVGDPDSPSPGFSSIADAVEDIAAGKMVVVVDDESRENEGDLIMAAALATSASVAFMVNECSGIVCVGMRGADLDRLRLPPMVPPAENDEAMLTAFAVTVVRSQPLPPPSLAPGSPSLLPLPLSFLPLPPSAPSLNPPVLLPFTSPASLHPPPVPSSPLFYI
eukprot:SM004005S15582  [mRNA]  locus=s4005:18:856:- [translate_table: standard]